MCQEWVVADAMVEPGLAGVSREAQRRRILADLERPLELAGSAVAAPGMPSTVAAADKELRALRAQIYAEPAATKRAELNVRAVALQTHRTRLAAAVQNGP